MVTVTVVMTESETGVTTVTMMAVCAAGMVYGVMVRLVCGCRCVVQFSTRDTNDHNPYIRTAHNPARLRQGQTYSDRSSCR
jgi:hypothetical protein